MKTKKVLQHLIVVMLVVLFTKLSMAQAFKLNDKLPVDSEVKVGKLSNGLTYYIRKNVKPEKKVQLRLVVNAGSVLEDADQQGLAHVMEHMNFNGLKHFPKNELESYLQSIGVKFGADLNAYTSFDETVYILPIPTDNQDKIEKGFTILEDWAFNALLDTTEINKERGVVLEESRLGKGASERMGKKYYPVLFNGSTYASRLPIGKDSIIQNFKASSLERFYKTWYRPDLMAVVVVGDIDPAVAEQEIIKHFGSYHNPVKELPRPSLIPIAERKENVGMVLTDKEQPYNIVQIYDHIEKSNRIINWGDYKTALIENLFNSLMNQRLDELRQQANPPFLYGTTSLSSFIRGYRALTSVAVVGDKPTKDAVDAIVSTIESVRKFGFLSTELERAKSSLLNATEKAFNNNGKMESGSLVNEYVNNFLSGTPIIGITRRYNFVKQVLPTITLEELNALSKEMESKQGKFALMLASEKSAGQLPSNAALLKILAEAHQLPIKAYEEKAIASALIDKLPTAGKVVTEAKNSVLGTTDFTLSNGITVTIKPTDFKNDEIRMDASRLGGSYNFGLADKQNAENACSIVDAMGVKDLSPTQIRKFLSGKTISVQPYLNTNDEGIEGSSSLKDFETFLQLVNLYFTQPRKDLELFQSYINSQKSFIKNMKSNPNSYFADTVEKIKYNNSPWANGIPDTADYNKINVDRVLNIYKEVFGNAYGMHFTFVGNVDIVKVKPLLELYLGSLPAKQKENKFTDIGLRPVKGIVEATIAKGAAKKSLVNIIFTGNAVYSKYENLKLQALIEVLNIKIIEQLREEMSGIYGGGMTGEISKLPYSNYTVKVSFPCGPENVDKLTKALFDLIKVAKDKGVEQKDLDKVKETFKKQNEDDLTRNNHWLGELSAAWTYQDDPTWILAYAKKVEGLTIADVQEAAQKYLNLNNYIKAVLNPEK